MHIDRSKITIKPIDSEDDDEFVDASPSERIMMAWPLTQEIWDIYKPGYAKQRLQRNITALNQIDLKNLKKHI